MRPRRRVALLFVLALGVRLLHLALLRAAHPELIAHPLVDGDHYHRWAQDIFTGTGLANDVFFMHPVYPHVMALVYAVTGPSPLAVALLQTVLGAGSVVLVHELARRWFDDRVALVAGLVMALYRPFIATDALLETVTLGVFLMLLALWLCQSAQGPRAWLRLTLAGVTFVLAALCRGNLLLAAPALVAARFMAVDGTALRRARAAAPVVLGMAAVLATVGARNLVVGGEFVVTTAAPGATFYLGNYRGSTGTHQPPPFLRPEPRFEQADYQAEAERQVGRPLTRTEASRFWRRRALEEIAADPGLALRRVFVKLGFAFAAYELADNYNLAHLQGLTPLGIVPLPAFVWVVGFAAVGTGLAWRRRRELVLPFGVAGLYLGSLALFYLSSRLRVYLAPFAIVFAAHGVLWCWDAARARRVPSAALAALVAALVMLLSVAPVPAETRRLEWAQALSGHAIALERAGRSVEARALQERALALDGSNPFLLTNVGLLALTHGEPARAVVACRAAVTLRPHLPTAHSCLGIALARSGQFGDAERALRQALALDRLDPELRYNLGVLLAATRRGAEAGRLFSEILAAHPEHAGARQGLETLRAGPESNR